MANVYFAVRKTTFQEMDNAFPVMDHAQQVGETWYTLLPCLFHDGIQASKHNLSGHAVSYIIHYLFAYIMLIQIENGFVKT